MSNRDFTAHGDVADDGTGRLPCRPPCAISTAMEAAAHYRHLLGLGREEFLAAAAPAVFVRRRAAVPDPAQAGTTTLTMTRDEPGGSMGGDPPAGGAMGTVPRGVDQLGDVMAAGSTPGRAGGLGRHALRGTGDDQEVDGTTPHGKFTPESVEMDLYPLAKKPGASFRDRITIGRTTNNDVVISDSSVSRLHAYVRQADGWIVADAGSKNGSWLDGVVLEPRRETRLAPGATIQFGDVQLTFYRSEDLFDLMGGDHGRR